LIEALQTKLSGQKEVITYCSVGYRSSMIAEKLMNNGIQNVRSLEGGIFEWANRGHPVFSGNGTTEDLAKYVHPFDKKWGKFLNPELHPPDY